MDRLELRRVTCYPSVNAGDVVILVGNFGIPAGLRAAEASLSSQQVCDSVLLPLQNRVCLSFFCVTN